MMIITKIEILMYRIVIPSNFSVYDNGALTMEAN
jgi:hypothetical protein